MRTIWATLLCLLFCVPLKAQETQLFHGGFYAGFSSSQLSGDDLSGFHKIGPYGGAFVNIHISPQSLLQLEISYIQKGSRGVSKNLGLIYNCNLQYFEIPFLYKYNLPGKLRRFSLEAGPATGFLIKTTNVERNAYGLLHDRDPFNLIDLSGMGGISIRLIENDKFGFSTNLRFSQSVVRVRKHASGAVYRWNRGQYNSVLALILVAEF